MTFLSITLAYLGFLALALAMPRHAGQIGQPNRLPGYAAQGVGALLLATSLWPALQGWPRLSIAITVWLGGLSLAALVLGLVLSLPAAARGRAPVAAPAVLGIATSALVLLR